MADKKVVEIKPKFALTVKFDGSRTAAVYRPGMPFFIDIVDNVLNSISSYKEEDIEVIGEKPGNWKSFFPDPVVDIVDVAVEPIVEAIVAA